MSTIVFGVEVVLRDSSSPVTADAAIGLYNRTSNLDGDAAASQPDITVDDASDFNIGELITISDTNASETRTILSIAGNKITVDANLSNTYVEGSNGKVYAGSVFRWVQNSISGVSGWQHGILTKNGISNFGRGADLRNGGNIASPKACNISILNTNKFWNTIKGKTIYFNGLEFRIYEFTDTAKNIKWSGVCENVSWDATTYKFNVKQFYNNRKANIISSTEEDIVIPATFGVHDSAKLVQTVKTEESVTNSSLVSTSLSPANLSVFKINSCTNLTVGIQIADVIYGTPTLDLVGKYIKVLNGDNEGSVRRILTATCNFPSSGIVSVTIDAYFETDLIATNYVKIMDYVYTYDADTAPCKGFLNEFYDTTDSEHQISIYSEDNKRFYLIGNSAFEITSDADKNTVSLAPKFIYKNPDSVVAAQIKSMATAELAETLTTWGITGYTRAASGIFVPSAYGTSIENVSSANLNHCLNRDYNSYASISYRAVYVPSMVAIEFDAPSLPENIEYDTLMALVKSKMTATFVTGPLDVRFKFTLYHRLFSGSSTQIMQYQTGWITLTSGSVDHETDNSPDYYYTTNAPEAE